MLVYIRGAGDIATGVAARLVRAGVSVVMADIAVPTCIRRTISFCEAIRLGEVEVEGIRARLAQTPAEALAITEAGDVAVVVDPQAKMLGELKPAAVVDAILAKRNLGTAITDAPVVVAAGPGFTAEALARAGELLYTEAARSDTAHQGFGLYFARRVALSHSGTLRLSNTPGGCAELRLPICEQIEK